MCSSDLTVRNQGPGDIDNFAVAVNDSSDIASPKQTMTGGLDTGVENSWSFPWTMVEGQTAYFMVDHGQKVSETNESNNSANLQLSTTMLSNLELFDLSHSPIIADVNDDVEWTVRFRNLGPGYVLDDFYVGMYDQSGALIDEVLFSPPSKGGTGEIGRAHV